MHERQQYSQLKNQVDSELYEGKLARKQKVQDGQRRLKEKIQQIESLKGRMRQENYSSRVSLNQSRIEEMSE
jgi:translation elongation factor EF-4